MNSRILLVILTGALLQGCSSTKDTPEVTGMCRSCKPYVINGKEYEPQLDFNYDETGTASWYGPGFHGKPKATGEKFDMHAISAAHKTLRLPSVVLVEHIETGRTLELVVDDRGPFPDGRIIDLSKGAAQELGVAGLGITQVRVKCLEEKSRDLANYMADKEKRKGRTILQVYEEEFSGQTWPSVMPAVAQKPIQPKKKSTPKRLEERVTTPPIMEISYGAHKQNLNQLVAESQKAPMRPEPRPDGKHYIHVGDYGQKGAAKTIALSVSRLGRTEIATSSLSRGKKVYKVRLGPYKTINEANHSKASLLKAGYKHAKVTNIS